MHKVYYFHCLRNPNQLFSLPTQLAGGLGMPILARAFVLQKLKTSKPFAMQDLTRLKKKKSPTLRLGYGLNKNNSGELFPTTRFPG
jgi:hypothetical protein